MRGKGAKVLEEALRLPQSARAALAGKLIDSLDAEVDDDAAAAWAAEIDKRVRDIESGRVALVAWSQVRRDILKSRRETKRR